MTKELKVISMEDIQRCFKKWDDCWEYCIEAKGHYSKGSI